MCARGKRFALAGARAQVKERDAIRFGARAAATATAACGRKVVQTHGAEQLPRAQRSHFAVGGAARVGRRSVYKSRALGSRQLFWLAVVVCVDGGGLAGGRCAEKATGLSPVLLY